MESQKPKEGSKDLDILEKQEEKLGKVYINGYSLTMGKMKRKEVNFSSLARLEASNEIRKK